MNRFALATAVSVAGLMLGVVACTPSKEDKPPSPKAAANADGKTEARSASAVAMSTPAPGVMAALPKLGPAPAWKLQDVDGKPVSSDQFKGKVVVVDFWATWCPPCRAEIPGYIALQQKYGKDGFVIVGISLDQAGPDVVKAFMKKEGVNYQMVMADDSVVTAFGGVDAIPTTFLIDRSGEVRDRKMGAEEKEEYEKKITAVLGEKA